MKIIFSEEDARAHEIILRENLAILENAQALLNFSIKLITEKGIDLDKAPGINLNVLLVSTGIFTKICRLYKSIYLLGVYGHSPEVEFLLRGLFESTVTLFFLLKHRVILMEDGKRVPPVHGKPLTTPF